MVSDISTTAIQTKLDVLDRLLDSYGSVLVAFSGGTDSSFLLHRAITRLSRECVTAAYLDSFFQQKDEKKHAERIADRNNVNLVTVHVDIALYETVTRNEPDRCYHCKKVMFTKLVNLARERKINVVADGTNLDDLADYRPGRRAVSESGAVSPLLEAGLRKREIQEIMAEFNIPGRGRGPSTCLASRVQYGETLTFPLLQRIGEFEAFLTELGFTGVRVRVHNNLVRLELDPGQLERAASQDIRFKIAEFASSSGFDFATLDLEGYRTGSMNIFKGETDGEEERSGRT